LSRPVGSRELSIEQIRTIVELSFEGEERPTIAEEAEVGTRTVWRFQKDFDLL